MNTNPTLALRIKMQVLNDLNRKFNSKTVVLDFGCGNGRMVKELRDLGYEAYGCDVSQVNPGTEDYVIRPIDMNHYRLPFEDNTFDFIFSHCVLEHVKNYRESMAEMARVLKPSGCCIHFFPSRYKPIETHIFVPFSTIVQSKVWLKLWVTLGIHNEWQVKGIEATTNSYYHFLKHETNYLTRKELTRYFKNNFIDVRFCEDLVLKNSSGKGKYLYQLSKLIPVIPNLYSMFRTRTIFAQFPMKQQDRSLLN